MKKIYINTDEIIEKFKAENEDYKDKELTLAVYEKSYSIKYKNEILQNVSALDGYTFETVADIFPQEMEIRLNKNKLKEQFKERYPEYKDKEITVKIYPYSMEFWCDNKRIYEEQANKGSRYIDNTEIDAELEKESKKELDNINKIRRNNADLRLENAKLKAELEKIKNDLKAEKHKTLIQKNKIKRLEEDFKALNDKEYVIPKRAGRPEKDIKELDLFKIYYDVGYDEKHICELLDISSSTYYRYKRRLRENNLI